jgi:RHS repeat-associated protein
VTPSGGQAQTLTYDQANRLTKFAAASTTSYGYNGDGLRMCKYAGSSTQPCQAGGNTPFVWDVAGLLPLLLKDGTTVCVYGPGGLPLEQVGASTTYWFHRDQIGSTRLITDSTGASQATYAYDPFGGLASSTGSITNPFRFCGQYNDNESGFYYLRARYYDPSNAQFLSRDPIAPTTRQPYGYVSNNPINGSDVAGLWPDLGGVWNSARSWWHSNAQTIGMVAGTISMACGLASLAVIDAPITGTCAVAFGVVAMMADVEQGHTDTFTMASDLVGIIPGGSVLGKGASLAFRACKGARLAELGATTAADVARDSSTVRRMARVSDDLAKAGHDFDVTQAIYGQAMWVKQMVGW